MKAKTLFPLGPALALVLVLLERSIWGCVGRGVPTPERWFNWAACRKVTRKGLIW